MVCSCLSLAMKETWPMKLQKMQEVVYYINNGHYNSCQGLGCMLCACVFTSKLITTYNFYKT